MLLVNYSPTRKICIVQKNSWSLWYAHFFEILLVAPHVRHCGTSPPLHCTACFRLLVRGPFLLWQQLVPGDIKGDQLTGPQFLHWSNVAHPGDGAAEKMFFLLCLQRLWVKNHVFCHCDWVMHRIHQNERHRRTNKFFQGVIRA